MSILKENTKSICPDCFQELDASVIEENGQVYLIKRCVEHGEFKVLIEKDPSFYKRFMNKDSLGHQAPFTNLAISVTHLCDLNCNICYLPERDNYAPSLEQVKRLVSGFTGKFIWLTGGEPLLREDLPQLIKCVVENGKTPIMLTNGLKLTDIGYLKRLKRAGLERVHFSFNGFDDNIYKKINGRKLLKDKLRALRNIKKIGISPTVSMMLVKGVNENEIRKIYRYCLKNNHFIKRLRIRSSVPVGKYTERESFYLSEVVKMVGNVIGVSQERLIDHYLKKSAYYSGGNGSHMPCHLEIDLFSLLMDEIGLKYIGKSPIRKIQSVFKLLPMVGLRNLIKMVLRKLAGRKRLIEFTICIRVWPDKYRIDLGEIERCNSSYASCYDNKILPFCYALILNEKDHLL